MGSWGKSNEEKANLFANYLPKILTNVYLQNNNQAHNVDQDLTTSIQSTRIPEALYLQ